MRDDPNWAKASGTIEDITDRTAGRSHLDGEEIAALLD